MKEKETQDAVMAASATPAIYAAMAKIMAETNAIGKNQRNQSQNFNFRGIDDVMNSLHAIFAKNNVFILPQVIDYTVGEKPTKSGSLQYCTRANICFKFICGTDGSSVEARMVGEAMDMADKGMNKAMSIALKYALMQMLLIPTQEMQDPDAVTPEPTRHRTIREMATDCSQGNPVLSQLLFMVADARSREELNAIYRENVAYQQNQTFVDACQMRATELSTKAA